MITAQTIALQLIGIALQEKGTQEEKRDRNRKTAFQTILSAVGQNTFPIHTLSAVNPRNFAAKTQMHISAFYISLGEVLS